MATTSLQQVTEVAGLVAADPSRRQTGRIPAAAFPDGQPAVAVERIAHDVAGSRVRLLIAGAVEAGWDGRLARMVEVDWHALQVPAGTTGPVADAAVDLAVAAAMLSWAAAGLQELATLPATADLLTGDEHAGTQLRHAPLDQAGELVALLAQARTDLLAAQQARNDALYPCPAPEPHREPLPVASLLPTECATTAVQSRKVRSLLHSLIDDVSVTTDTDRLGNKTTFVRWTAGLSKSQVQRLVAGLRVAGNPPHRGTVELVRRSTARMAAAAAVRFDDDHGRPADGQVTADARRLSGYAACQDGYVTGADRLRRRVDLLLRLHGRFGGDVAGLWATHRQLLQAAAPRADGEQALDTYTALLDGGMDAGDAAAAALRLGTRTA